MPMSYEELDDKTRSLMLKGFEAEEAGGNPYRSIGLNDKGRAAFPDLMRDAIKTGTELTLTDSLNDAGLWKPTEIDIKNNVPIEVPRHVLQSALRLGLGEFSVWYVHGLARRLLDEGETQCQIYNAQPQESDNRECSKFEGAIVGAKVIYDNLRIRYWPQPGDKDALQVPFGVWCHHVIRRVNRRCLSSMMGTK
jgi:hypothetical protein